MDKKILKIFARCIKEQNLYNGKYDDFINLCKPFLKYNVDSFLSLNNTIYGWLKDKYFLNKYMFLNYDIPKLLYEFLVSNYYLINFAKNYNDKDIKLQNIEDTLIADFFYSIFNKEKIKDFNYSRLDGLWNIFLLKKLTNE